MKKGRTSQRVGKKPELIKYHPLLKHLSATALIVFGVLLVYSGSLNGIWALDDFLVNQPLGTAQASETFGARKIAYFSFVLNQAINPQDPVNFRLFNILVHILNSILIYIIALLTLKITLGKDKFQKTGFAVSLICASIFAIHPLNINVVAYIIQRMTSLATFFVLLSLLSYIYANRADRMLIKIALFMSTGVFIALGVFSKENAVMAAPLIMLYDWFFLSRCDKRAFLKKFIIIAVVLTGACLVFFFARRPYINEIMQDVIKVIKGMDKPLAHAAWASPDVYWSPVEHVLTEFRVVSRYMFLILLPLPGFLVFDWWGFQLSKGPLEPITTFLSIVLITGLAVFSIIRLKKYPFLSFGILWYLIAISFESFIAVGSDLYFEHRNYLPLTGLLFGISAQAVPFMMEKVKNRYYFRAGFLAIFSFLGIMTFQRNLIWKDPVTFWKDTVIKVPYNIRANLALANSYYALSDFKNAEIYYKTSFKIAKEERSTNFAVNSLYRLGFLFLQLERLDESGRVIEAFERLSPVSYRLGILKGYYTYLKRDMDNAIKTYLQALDKSTNIQDTVTVFTLLGDAYRDMGLFEKALNSYDSALKLNHSFPAAYHGKAKVQMLKGDLNAASEHLNKVLSLTPYNFHALSDMAHLTILRGEGADKALPFAQKAVLLNPPFYKPYLIMGTILTIKGRDGEAEGFYTEAVKLHVPDYLLHFNKAWAYSLRGEREKQRYHLAELLKLKEVPEHIRDTAKKILSQLAAS